jgi:dUTP pyrophosphatase
MALNVIKIIPTAILPVRASAGAAGYDLFSTDSYVVLPGRRVVVSTGITVQLPPGTYGRIAPRSGLAVKHGLDTLAGVIDPDYTGEIKVVLQNLDNTQPFVIRPGYRIAQLILENYTVAEVVEQGTAFPPGSAASLPTENTPLVDATNRGAAGFGSTGLF